MGFRGLTRILLGKPGEYQGLIEKGRIPRDDLFPKNRLCRNHRLMTFQIPSAITNAISIAFSSDYLDVGDFVSTFTSLVRARHALYMLLQNYTRPTRPALYTSRVGEAINFTCVSHYSGHIKTPLSS